MLNRKHLIDAYEYSIFREKKYDLDTPNRVKVTLYGQVLNDNYSQLLYSNNTLDLMTVFLLDRVQKKLPISKVDFQELKKRNLAEGRYPNIFVSHKVADMTDQKSEYVKAAGISDDACMQLISQYLSKFTDATKKELSIALDNVLPGHLDEKQKSRRVSYILKKMKDADFRYVIVY